MLTKITAAATQHLLACGIAAGPQFTLVSALQVLGRSGFDLSRHPLSLLATGDLAGSRSPTSW